MHWLNHPLETEERRFTEIGWRSGGKHSEGSFKIKLDENSNRKDRNGVVSIKSKLCAN